MSNIVEFRNVWKKFRKGEKFNSLRDSIPNFFRNIFKEAKDSESLKAREFWAVKNVNFTVKKGEVVGIIGPNGAGKSTILKLLSGIIVPNQGSMDIKGRLSALIEVTAGFHPELTGRENVYLNGTILGMKRKEIDEKFKDILEFSGIEEFIDTPVKRYSSGMFSRLGFSVAAHVNPDLLLVDEVLSVGDIAFQSKCAQKMRELLERGTTIILVSHNMQLMQSLCRRVILLNKGEVVKEGGPEEVIPYYENIVLQHQEEEFQAKLKVADYKVKLSEKSPVGIIDVELSDENNHVGDKFSFGSKIKARVRFKSTKKIENPIFSVDITRADGVLCCTSNTKDNDYILDVIDGESSVNIDFGDMKLMSNIYSVKIAIWDKDMIHPYVIRRKDVFRIEADSSHEYTNAVFSSKIEWKA